MWAEGCPCGVALLGRGPDTDGGSWPMSLTGLSPHSQSGDVGQEPFSCREGRHVSDGLGRNRRRGWILRRHLSCPLVSVLLFAGCTLTSLFLRGGRLIPFPAVAPHVILLAEVDHLFPVV